MNFTTPTSASHAFAATLIDAAVNRRDCRTTKRQSFERAALRVGCAFQLIIDNPAPEDGQPRRVAVSLH